VGDTRIAARRTATTMGRGERRRARSQMK
jgi:hypothetical protein